MDQVRWTPELNGSLSELVRDETGTAGFRKPFPSPDSSISNSKAQWEQCRSWLRRLVSL